MSAPTPDRAALAERLRFLARGLRRIADTPCNSDDCDIPHLDCTVSADAMDAAAAALAAPAPNIAFDPVNLGYGYCPVQIEGTYHNRRYYFRARGSRFSLRVGPAGDASEYAAVNGAEVLRGEIATTFAAGYMPHQLALALVDWALTQREGVLDAPPAIGVQP